jgi:hypothetical protein
LRLGAAGFEAVALSEGVLGPGVGIGGAAVEPGSGSVWVSYVESGDVSELARLTRIHADGSVDPPTLLPGPGEPISRKGPAGPIACPAAGQCWMATKSGWLFHLGPALPRDPDPLLHTLVTFRPLDPSVPSVPPIALPVDDSGASTEAERSPLVEGGAEPLPKRTPAKYGQVKSRLLRHNVLELTFVLRVRARVQLRAERKGEVVAKTPRYTLGRGPQKLRLRLNPKRWPTKLDLDVHEVKGGSK